ncbi:hypothetical protein CFC21_062602 [Triticum aestivum]|uniref:Uncharacterized protein n=2 Tax=Triticum aestivum TaxID=4565 RepID=A0A3B6ETF7_WHEAT|nr:hypothetical protein CFC21_062602 [Triticum aestivum]
MNEYDRRGSKNKSVYASRVRLRPEVAPGLFAWTYIRQPPPPQPPPVFLQTQRERDREIPNTPRAASGRSPSGPARAEPEAAIFKAKSMADNEEVSSLKAKTKAKAKSKADKEEVIRKAKAKAEAEAEIRKAKAEAAKEAGVIKACCCGSDDDDVPYDKVYHDSDAEEDNDTIMARIVARWDIFMEEEKARFPDQTYRVYLPGERTGDESSDSDDEHEYYLRKFGMK